VGRIQWSVFMPFRLPQGVQGHNAVFTPPDAVQGDGDTLHTAGRNPVDRQS
jgi:hypothetical protein